MGINILGTKYVLGRTYAGLLAGLGLLMIVLGGYLFVIAAGEHVDAGYIEIRDFLRLFMLPSFGFIVFGLFISAQGAVMRASFDTADMTREMLKLTKHPAKL
ncbi:MAG: hypothetical protein ABL957_02020 [Parvularculaceae bacterium]